MIYKTEIKNVLPKIFTLSGWFVIVASISGIYLIFVKDHPVSFNGGYILNIIMGIVLIPISIILLPICGENNFVLMVAYGSMCLGISLVIVRERIKHKPNHEAEAQRAVLKRLRNICSGEK